MTLQEVMKELESYGNESTKKVLIKHGAKEPFFGVKVADMKKIQKKIKKDQDLALQLYDTKNGDAMYLAGLIADEKKMTKKQLDKWASMAEWSMISEYTVPWIAADSGLAWECGMKWIDSPKENVASSGWSALSSHLSVCDNADLDLNEINDLLKRIETSIHESDNRVRYTMNGFVIAVGSYVPQLSDKAIKTAQSIGKIEVNLGGTACKVPDAPTYINKVLDKGYGGKKRKMARC